MVLVFLGAAETAELDQNWSSILNEHCAISTIYVKLPPNLIFTLFIFISPKSSGTIINDEQE